MYYSNTQCAIISLLIALIISQIFLWRLNLTVLQKQEQIQAMIVELIELPRCEELN